MLRRFREMLEDPHQGATHDSDLGQTAAVKGVKSFTADTGGLTGLETDTGLDTDLSHGGTCLISDSGGF